MNTTATTRKDLAIIQDLCRLGQAGMVHVYHSFDHSNMVLSEQCLIGITSNFGTKRQREITF
jgi:hypothetical protein